ncbi:MAG: MBL fold metallo-hydrolase [Halobacteriales archaeon]|nr:MBL fold metallo-hydrolase [Halobacteriales archaeon]
MDSDDVHRLELATEWTPDHVAAYLVEAEEGLILVDAGIPGDEGEQELRDEFARLGYGFEDTDALLVTHPHVDHDGQVRAVVEESDATVYAHRDVPDRLRYEGLEERALRNAREIGIPEAEVEDTVDRWMEGIRTNRECFPPEMADVLLRDDETFEVAGHVFEAFHTPGHQREHLAYACDDLLFSGDALISAFRPVIYDVGFDDGMYESAANCYETFERLGAREAERVYPGHGPVFDDPRAAADNSLGSLDALVESVRETVESLEEATVLEVALNRKKPEHDLRHLIFDNIGAVGYLEAEGRLVSHLEDGVRHYRPAESGDENETETEAVGVSADETSV